MTDLIELIAPDGFAYINRTLRLLAYVAFPLTQEDAERWELMNEPDALALEAQWIAEDEAKYAPPSSPTPYSPAPYGPTSPYSPT